MKIPITGNIEVDYYDLLEKYLKNNPHKTELDLINTEIEYYEDFISQVTEEYYKKGGENGKNTEWLYNAILGYKKYLNYFKDKKRTLKNIENEIKDHSDNKDIDKVRTLILLGVVDNLHKQPQYKTSIGALATALSGVVGIKADVLRSYLNAYLNNPDAKQNPMNNKEAVQKIKNKLGIK